MRHTGSAGRTSRSNGYSGEERAEKRSATVRFALCLNDESCVDLVLGKVYRLLPDRDAAAEGLVRLVDESGEDYLYAADQFRVIRLPESAAARLESAGRAPRRSRADAERSEKAMHRVRRAAKRSLPRTE
jgi:hypothetical protein